MVDCNMIDCKQMMDLKGKSMYMLIAKDEERTEDANLITNDIDPKIRELIMEYKDAFREYLPVEQL